MPERTCTVSLEGEKGGRTTLSFFGRLSLDNLAALEQDLKPLFQDPPPTELVIDLSGVEHMDSSGGLLLVELEERAREGSIPFSLRHVSEKDQEILSLIDREALKAPPLIAEKQPDDLIHQVGISSFRLLDDAAELITFLGELVQGLIAAATHPRSVRWADVLLAMRKVGVEGLPIVGLISFLLGLIIAFMSSLQLKQFGANTFIPALVSIAMVRELGPIMTAILVAGRSGSAFAAEIGTMKVNEEVDALVTMGFSPTRFLTIPRVIASLAMVPLLTVFADVFAIIGGLVVGVTGLELTIYTYVNETVKALDLFNVVTSLIKSLVFAFAIAAIGCQRGLRVRGGAEAVGSAATSAVVASLFSIIVIDSVFAIVLNYI